MRSCAEEDTSTVLHGRKPNQIMAEDIRLRREEGLIRKCYFAKRYKESTTVLRSPGGCRLFRGCQQLMATEYFFVDNILILV